MTRRDRPEGRWAILGCGYVGARLLVALEGAGESVIATTRQTARAAALGPSARVVDVRDADALASVLSPGVVIVDSIPTDASAGPHMGAVVAAAARAGAARRLAAWAQLVGLDGDGLVGHQTVRTSGSTTGLRWKRWLMKRRTALRTTAPISSRSMTSGSSRAWSASRTAAFTSSIRSSASFM